MVVRRIIGLNEPPLHLAVCCAVYIVFGADLWLQPSRWDHTPAYGNLLDIFNQRTWGTVYLIIATVMVLSMWRRHERVLAVLAHTLAIMLAAAWWVAFIVRWATDAGTTIVNVANWAVLLFLLIYSAVRLDRYYGAETLA